MFGWLKSIFTQVNPITEAIIDVAIDAALVNVLKGKRVKPAERLLIDEILHAVRDDIKSKLNVK